MTVRWSVVDRQALILIKNRGEIDAADFDGIFSRPFYTTKIRKHRTGAQYRPSLCHSPRGIHQRDYRARLYDRNDLSTFDSERQCKSTYRKGIAMSSILIVDDDQNLATALKALLTRNGNVVDVVHTAAAAKAIVEQQIFDFVITDLRVSNESGLDIIETVKAAMPETEVIMITGYGSIDTAVEAMKRGAADYLTKPFEDAELLIVVEKALNQKKMKNELKHLRKAFAESYSFDNIIGNSPAVRKIIDIVKQVAPQDINVLIWGESGTGKELFAKAIHNNSSRREGKFVAINCSAMPDLLLESELFGHVKGAFTSATSNKKGLFEEACGGTVFLDEVGDTSPSLQAKLLRVLQEEEIRPVGSNQTCKTNVRVIAATNKSLESLVSQGKFREDLYYRLNVISINLPRCRSDATISFLWPVISCRSTASISTNRRSA